LADKQGMNISAIALDGLNQAQASFEQSASRLSAMTTPGPEGGSIDTVDLSASIVEMLSAKQNFAANVNVLKTADHIERQALDILA
jgi:hypothetical protein